MMVDEYRKNSTVTVSGYHVPVEKIGHLHIPDLSGLPHSVIHGVLMKLIINGEVAFYPTDEERGYIFQHLAHFAPEDRDGVIYLRASPVMVEKNRNAIEARWPGIEHPPFPKSA